MSEHVQEDAGAWVRGVPSHCEIDEHRHDGCDERECRGAVARATEKTRAHTCTGHLAGFGHQTPQDDTTVRTQSDMSGEAIHRRAESQSTYGRRAGGMQRRKTRRKYASTAVRATGAEAACAAPLHWQLSSNGDDGQWQQPLTRARATREWRSDAGQDAIIIQRRRPSSFTSERVTPGSPPYGDACRDT